MAILVIFKKICLLYLIKYLINKSKFILISISNLIFFWQYESTKNYLFHPAIFLKRKSFSNLRILLLAHNSYHEHQWSHFFLEPPAPIFFFKSLASSLHQFLLAGEPLISTTVRPLLEVYRLTRSCREDSLTKYSSLKILYLSFLKSPNSLE